MILFYDNRMSIGQMLDQLCNQMALKSCLDFNNPDASQINIYAVSLDKQMTLLPFETKVGEIKAKVIDWFEQGDDVYLVRGVI